MNESTPILTEATSLSSSEDLSNTPSGNANVEIEEILEEKKINSLQSLMSLLKGNIGTGILAIPAALKHGGLWVGVAGIFFVGCMAAHCMQLIVSCSRHVTEISGKQGLDYGKLVGEALLIGPAKCRRLSAFSRVLVNVFLAVTQFGFCTVYIVFMASNLKMVLEEYLSIHWSIQVYQCFVVVFLVPYLCITDLRILSFFSGVANLFIVFGLSVIFYTCFIDLPSYSVRPAFGSWATFPLYFSIVIFTFEGIGVVLPLENKMKHPREFTGWFGIINLGMTITTCLIAGIGFFGYLRFGDDTKDSITLNLPSTVFYNIVRLAFVVAIFFTYGIQFYVPLEFLWRDIRPKLTNWSFLYKFGEYFIRLFFLALTFLLAAAIPHLDLMISLIGALASTAVALIIPALLDILCTHDKGYGLLRWKLIKNIFIALIGFSGFIAGTGTTIYEIIKVST